MGSWAQDWFGSVCWSFRHPGCHPGMDSPHPSPPLPQQTVLRFQIILLNLPCHHCSLYSSYVDGCCLTFFLFSQGQWDNLEIEIKRNRNQGEEKHQLPARIVPWCLVEPIPSLPGLAPRLKGSSREWSTSSCAGVQARLRALRCLQILSTGADNIKRLLRKELLMWLPDFTTLFLKSASLGTAPSPTPVPDCGQYLLQTKM